ncbi:MAG: 5-formyltetrahydrofolate cyclo-ligase [Planctomycetes bacterium]|nr:5-formyltetrahydrofolate cyclo-ligase [Planctomycetota bacterium]
MSMPPQTRSKDQVRGMLREEAKGFSAEARAQASELACARLIGTPWFASARTVMLYAPMETELDISLVAKECRRTGRMVALPAVDWGGGTMTPRRVDDWARLLVVGKHGVQEPRGDTPIVEPEDLDLIVVPGLGFGRDRTRLGRGGGFYDRFLSGASIRAAKVGMGFSWQLLASVPTTDSDVTLDGIVTERDVIV